MFNEDFDNRKKIDFFNSLRKDGLLALISNDYINMYKVKSNDKLEKLILDIKNNFDEIYSILFIRDDKFMNEVINNSYNPFFKNMVSYHPTTKEEIYDYYDLFDKSNIDKFYEENSISIENNLVIDDKMSTTILKKESIDETINRIADNRVTCLFKKNSKLAEILLSIDNYFNLDFIAQIVCQFLNSIDVDFSSNQFKSLDSNEDRIMLMKYTVKENSLSYEEKIMIVKDILNAFDIECIYSKKVEELLNTDNQLLLEYAKHNTYILENSEFTKIYNEIINNTDKKYIKRISN